MIDHLERASPFGPWALDIDPAERRCRWRVLASLSIVFAGPDSELAREARAAKDDDSAAERAWRALLAMAPIPRRRLLSVWAAMNALA